MKKNSSNLNKKRARPVSPLTITIGKLPHEKYCYISDSISDKTKNTKIKISMIDMKEDNKQVILKEQQEEHDATLDVLGMDPQILKDELPKIVNTIQTNENENIYLPISANWFNMDNIHEIEIKSLPEFFVGKYPSKTPKIYKEYRNFIINLYRENSSMYLSSKTCNKHLAGDSAAIMRIHAFLEHWGLINFKVNPKFKPNFIPKAFNFKSPIFIDASLFMYDNSQINDNISNYNNPESPIVLTNKRKCVSTLYPINKIPNEIFNKFLDNLTDMEKGIKSNNQLNSDFYKNFKNINFLSQNYRPKCDVCGNFCMVSWYISKENINNKNNHEDENESDNDMGVSISIDEKSLKNEFCLICEDCYNNKEIPLPKNLKRENFEISSIYNLFSKEKLNMKLKEKIKEQNWTEEENKKLLESMKNNNNWDDIVKSLGKNNNKTKTDCILHLIQMPIIELNDDESDKEEKEINDTEKDQDKEKDNENIKEGNNVLITENEFLQINQEEENKDNNNNNIEIEKENIVNNNNINLIKIDEEKKEEEKNDRMNNKMLEIFMRLFKRYLNEKDKDNKKEKINDENGNIINKYFKEVIYKTFAKSIDKCKELKNDEKIEMKNIVDILVYLEMKKIELKMNYFRQFERLLEYKKTLLKTIETQIIQERIKLITKKLLLQQKQHQANETK